MTGDINRRRGKLTDQMRHMAFRGIDEHWTPIRRGLSGVKRNRRIAELSQLIIGGVDWIWRDAGLLCPESLGISHLPHCCRRAENVLSGKAGTGVVSAGVPESF